MLGGSREEKWLSQWRRKRSVSWNLPKLSQLWLCNEGLGSCTTQNHLQTKQFVNGTWNSSRVPACGPGRPVRFAAHGSVWYCVVHDPKPPLQSHNWLSFGKFQDTERFLIHCERHFSSQLPPSGGTWKYAKAPSTKKNLQRFSTYWYAHFCRVCLGCCAVEFGNPGGTYE